MQQVFAIHVYVHASKCVHGWIKLVMV